MKTAKIFGTMSLPSKVGGLACGVGPKLDGYDISNDALINAGA